MMLVWNISLSLGSGSIRMMSTQGSAPPTAERARAALIGEQLERLIANLWEAHVRDALGFRAGAGGRPLLGVVYVGDQRVHDDDEFGAGLDGNVEVGGRQAS